MSQSVHVQNIENIAQFYIRHQPHDIPRVCSTHHDCVINAFEILNIIDEKKAIQLRRYITNRNTLHGLTIDELIAVINNEADSRKIDYNFYVKQDEIQNIMNYANNYLLPSHAIILLFGFENQGHVILIAKNNDNRLTLIDLQERFAYCPLQNKECLEYLFDKKKNYWAVIAYKPKSDFSQEIEMLLDDSDVYSFGFGIGSIASKALSLGKSAVQQSKSIVKGVASQLKEEAKNQASQLKEEAKNQASQLKEEAKTQASQLKEEAKNQAVKQIQKI